MSSTDKVSVASLEALQLCFLGGFSVSRGGRPLLPFPYDKVRALLAYLVIERREHRRESLAHLLWPEVAGEQARSNLRRCLFDLRRILGDDSSLGGKAGASFLVSSSTKTLGFNFSAPYGLDVEQFLATDAPAIDPLSLLEQKAACYRGPFLAGLSLPEAPEFDGWLIAWREKLHHQALGLLEQLIRQHESRNDPARALEFAQQAIEFDFWQEGLQRTYLRLLARTSQAAALAHFDFFRRALAEDIGVAPDTETLQLVDAIRQGAGCTSVAGMPRSERRRLVALVCDVVIANADPEDIVERLAAPLAACGDSVRKRGGHVVTAQGGELIAYFGYPLARELAPREAIDVALEMQGSLSVVPGLTFRIGLHAGWALGGGTALPDEAGVLCKQARRLALASPVGGIAVSAELQGLTAPYFCFVAEHGSAAEQAIVTGKSLVSRRIDRDADRLSTLVGRYRELSCLTQRWSEVRQGNRLSVLLRSEAGMGKSRLAQALVRQVRLAGAPVIEMGCHPESLHSPYFPFVDFLSRRIGLAGDLSRAECEQRVAAFLAEMRSDTPAKRSCLLHLLGISPEVAAENEIPLLPQELKQQEGNLLMELFGGLVRGQPALLLLEDIHWADHATRDFLLRFSSMASDPALILYTSRTALPATFSPCLAAEIELPPLSTPAMEELVSEVAGTHILSESLTASIISRADGVPLFAEELTRSMLAGPREEIPASLWDTLAARLDDSGPAKRVAQQAAVIGRGFALDLLKTIVESDSDVVAGLQVLLRSGLVQRQPAGQYRFRHSLIRDAAYHSLSLAERRQIHQRLAGALRDSYVERLGEHPEILAHHLSAAIDPRAAEAWLAAGRQAAARSAHEEAIYDFYAGLAALQALPEADAYRVGLELQLQVALGTTLIAAEGYGSETAKSCFIRAWALSETAPENIDLFPVMWGLWLGGRSCDDEVHPLEFIEKMERTAAASDDPLIHMAVDYAYGNNYFWLGEFAQSRAHLESALRRAGEVPSTLLIARYGEDIGVSSRAFLSWVLWIQGDLDGARCLGEENIVLARQTGHAHTQGYALCFLAVLYRHLRRPDLAAATSQALLAHAEQHGLLLWKAGAAAILGWAMTVSGQPGGLDAIEQGIAGARIAMRIVETTFLAFLVDALVHLRRADAAGIIDQALDKAGRNRDVYFVPEFLHQQGNALLHSDPTALTAAEAVYVKALKLAESSGAHLLALRSTVSLGKLWVGNGRRGEAEHLLRRAMTAVSGSPDYPDMRDAMALLAELAD